MFDINSVSKRFFKITVNEIVYEIEPCSVKLLKRLSSVDPKAESAFDDLISNLKAVIDKNSGGNQIGVETLENLNIDQLMAFMVAYMEWMAEIKNSPNL